MRLALAMSGMVVNDTAAEIIVRVFEAIEKRGDNFNLKDASEIEIKVTGKLSRKKFIAK